MQAGADVILLDNMDAAAMKEAVALAGGRRSWRLPEALRWPACAVWPRRG